ncbi:MAG: TonB-dependent receptor [Acidobacteriia bacterium]|nr:TonB-dependent receptor [Terriglobia bacterium]
MKIVQLLKVLAVCAFVALAQNVVFGQAVNFAQIQGRISDPSGAAIVGAQITATQVETGLVRNTVSNAEGHYVLPNLPVGPYRVNVSASGFQNYQQKGMVLRVGETPELNIKLTVGSVAETIEVRADAALVETHENSISTMIDNERILQLPLDGRNMVSLVMGTGAATNPTLPSNDLNSTKNYGNGQSSGPSQTISVAGGQENANNYLLDGSDNNDAFSNVNAPYPFPDAIQEFSVQSSGLSARYGVHAGATVNAITKSGTNVYHGTLFEFLRNPAVNAHHVFFTTPAPGSRDDTVKRNQFGGTFGGPIKKDKLLFFVGFQGTRQSASSNLTTVIVPTAAAITNGDFSVMMAAACQSSGKAKTLKTVNGVTITGNKVNPASFNASALALLKYVPASTDATGCGKISYSYPQIWNEDQGVAKVDWNLSPKQTVFARYFGTDSRVPLPFDKSDIIPQSQISNQYARFQTGAIGHTFTISPNLVNSFHVTATRLAINRGPADDMINPASIGITVPSPVPNGLVLSISNYFATGGGSSMPGHFINNLYQIADDVDIVHGKHQFSFGINFMKMQLNYISTFQSNGQFTFGGNFSGDNLVDFMLGFPSNFAQGNPEAENWRYTYWGLYAQDNVKLRSNLTLNIGVRWEPYLPSTDIMKRGSHFDYAAFAAGTRSTVFPNAPAGLQYCGDPGVPCAYANNKLAQFSPRIGLIWDPTKNGSMTVRASYGLFYDSPEMYFFDRYADNSPYGSGVSFTPKASAGGTLSNPYAGQAGVPQFPLPFPKPGDPAAFFPLNGVYINNSFDVHPMYVQNWNFSVEKQLGSDWLLSLSYLGSKTTHVWVAYEANPGMNVPTVATPSAAAGGSGCTAGAAAATGNTNCRRALVVANPLQGQYFSNLTSLWDGANANYNAMLASVKHRFSRNYTFLSNYTWSHCISDQDFTGELTNSRPDLFVSPVTNPNLAVLKGDRGNCGFDIRHSFNVSVVANSPKYQGWKGVVLNNWQIAPLLTYRTGIPITVLTGVDTALTGTTTSFKDRPNLVGDPLSGTCANGFTVGSRNCWFNTAAYVAPATGTFGNVGRNSLSGPGGFTLDTSISRRFIFAETKELSLRLDTFNLLNHPVLGNPNASANSANFGKILSQVGNGRTLQAAVKFSF